MKRAEVMFHTATRIEGFYKWRLINRAGKTVDEGGGKNLLLNQGKDIAMQKFRTYQNYSPYLVGWEQLLRYVAVGTGNSTPTATQTTLDAEVARTKNTLDNGSDNGSWTRISDGVHEFTLTRTFDYSEANGNLTEFGAATSSSGDLVTRALFEDGSGNATVVTKTSDERLAIEYTLRFTLTPTTPTQTQINYYDSDGTTVTLTRYVSVCLNNNTTQYIAGSLADAGADMAIAHGAANLINQGRYALNYFRFMTSDFSQGYGITAVYGDEDYGVTVASYTDGDYYIDLSCEIGPESADKTIYGYQPIIRRSGSVVYGGLTFKFVDSSGNADPVTKDKDYRFKVGYRMSIS